MSSTRETIQREESKLELIQQLSVKNDCYKNNINKVDSRYTTFQTRGPVGLMLHSVGCPQPKAKVFADTWNQSGKEVAVHAALEPDRVIQCLPWNYRGWHGGGDSNNTHIGVEMTEPSTIKYTGGATWVETGDGTNTKTHVLGTYKTAVELFAFLCTQHKLDPLKDGVIISHAEGCKRGIASNHGDPEHLWGKHGLTMNQFRQDVKAAMGGSMPSLSDASTNAGTGGATDTPTLRKGNTGESVKTLQGKLTSAGYPLTVDGSFGPATEAAVMAFQNANKLSVDGVCGPQTWAALLAKDSTNTTPTQPAPAGDVPVIGTATATLVQAEAWAHKNNATDTFVSLARKYWDYAPLHGGVNPVIAYCMSALETGFGKFRGVLNDTFCNPCGMKTSSGGVDADPNAHQRFISWEDGVKAHLDHAALYAGATGYPLSKTPDPRHFKYLFGTGKTIETLCKGWCPGNANYAPTIQRMMGEIAAVTVAAPERSAVEITVDNAVADGVLTARDYWIDVLNGKTPANPEYIKIALDRYHERVK